MPGGNTVSTRLYAVIPYASRTPAEPLCFRQEWEVVLEAGLVLAHETRLLFHQQHTFSVFADLSAANAACEADIAEEVVGPFKLPRQFDGRFWACRVLHERTTPGMGVIAEL